MGSFLTRAENAGQERLGTNLTTPVSHQIPIVPHVREGTTEGHLSQHSLQTLSALPSPTFSQVILFSLCRLQLPRSLPSTHYLRFYTSLTPFYHPLSLSSAARGPNRESHSITSPTFLWHNLQTDLQRSGPFRLEPRLIFISIAAQQQSEPFPTKRGSTTVPSPKD